MKILFIIIAFIVWGAELFSQEVNNSDSLFFKVYSTLKEIDTSLQKINENVSNIGNEIIKEKEKSYSGQSIFEDRKDNSAIFLPYGGTIRLSTADASLKLSYVYRVSNSPYFYGFDISGKSNDGLVPLITKGDISPGAKVQFVIGRQELFRKSNILDGWLTLKIGYEGGIFKTYNPDSVFINQI